MKVGAIVQARMSSQRFPGKVLYKVAGKPMIQYLLERLTHCSSLDTVILATSTEESERPLIGFCKEYGVACYQGPLSNVALRFKELLALYQLDIFVRLSGDSPLLDQHLVDKAVTFFLREDYDLVTNILLRTYPKGQSVEVLRTDTFMHTYAVLREDEDFEHVTRYFYRNRSDFRIFNFESGKDLEGITLSVDTPYDMSVFSNIISVMDRPHWEYTFEEVLQIYWSLVEHL